MTYFTMGYWVLGLAIVVSLAGAVVGFACVRQSTMSVTAHFRMVWLVAGSVSIGGVGIWLAVYVNMLGMGAPTGVVRYDLTRTVGSAILAIVSILAGLLLAGREVRSGKLITASVVTGVGIGVTHYLALGAIRVQGSVQVSVAATIEVLVAAIVIAVGVLWVSLRIYSIGLLTAAAAVVALAVTGMHYLGMFGVGVHVDKATAPPTGEDLFTLFVPVFVLGTLSLAVPITAVLVAPDRTARVMAKARSTTPPPRPRKPSRTPTPIG
ncbi:MHYT domain-containing protein [Nocardia sp. BMG111209]|uniref:MHYT domain-containing protein n=1 Tax=Nocardia sp. BMG111209 TaxID=1160137 RepID=UPI0003808C59|nr:MHYT domain-containing protein [Nocardia sp. BMG111209]